MASDRTPALALFGIFTRLGLTSFGGPVAHIGYFHREFVARRGWLTDAGFAELTGLCQFLPGPASSKLGFSIGLQRAGLAGALAAWAGFTWPSVVLLLLFAQAAPAIAASAAGRGLLHGLMLAAVAVVAQAVWRMAQTLTPDVRRALIAVVAAVVALTTPPAIGQITAIALGGCLGLIACRTGSGTAALDLSARTGRATATVAMTAFAILLLLAVAATGDSPAAMAAAYYRSGALVFGGGHVVLPLLDAAVVKRGWADPGYFLAGYGAAQAMPGPLFAFAAYLGAASSSPVPGVPGATMALVAIFLPGLLLQLAALPFWGVLRSRPMAQAAVRGINASVVGLLAAALWRPVGSSAILAPADAVIAVIGFLLLTRFKAAPLAVVGLTAAAATGLALL